MDNFERAEILKSFRIIADTREQSTKQAAERFKAFGVPVERATLDYGDYCGNITLPSGELIDTSVKIRPLCVIERKMGLDELAGCLTRGRERFKHEFERAQDAGAKVFLLVENGSFEAIQSHRYKSRFNPSAFQASLLAWMIRYGFTILFCKSGTSGNLIKEILYRDMKERLERGELE